jgi:hypothetical protein
MTSLREKLKTPKITLSTKSKIYCGYFSKFYFDHFVKCSQERTKGWLGLGVRLG